MNRIRKLLEQMGAGVYERDRVLALALLSAVAGESIFLLGPPGVGKSLVARRLKLAFREARAFEYLMSRFSTPDEIFGPVSISKLKDCDTYERLTDGYLPSADIVFLDEIWKAGPSIQNALLTVLNEKLFRNGDREMRLLLKGIIAASNELPARDEGLEALWDRFLLRLVVLPLESEEAFARMITETTAPTAEMEDALRITPKEYASWQPAIDKVEVGGAILAMIARIRVLLKKGIPVDKEQEAAPIYVSDRQWKKIARLLRATARRCAKVFVGRSNPLPPTPICNTATTPSKGWPNWSPRRWQTASIERGSLLTRKVPSVWSATCGTVVRHSTTRRSQQTGGSFGRGWRNAIRTKS